VNIITSQSMVSVAACETRVRSVVTSILQAHRRHVAAVLGTAALAFAPALFAQEITTDGAAVTADDVGGGGEVAAAADSGAAMASVGDVLGEVTVTGSRIAREGFYAPTPVSVISSEEMAVEAPANVTDFVNTLPSVRGSSTPASSSGAVSAGTAGISALNLRAMGSNRTLVLFDGKRSVVSAATGLVDVNTFPQTLIERVEVVTGGASSQYGSDAVSGVVNFIIDKDFTGLKSDLEYGQMFDFDGGPSEKANVTYGTPLLSGRGHLILSGEYFNQQGEHEIYRDWQTHERRVMQNTAANIAAGEPFYIVGDNIGIGQYTPGGLIIGGLRNGATTTSIPSSLLNTYFGVNGAQGKLALGNPRNGIWMQGGDYEYARSAMIGTNTLVPEEDRGSAFSRFSYSFSDKLNAYAQASYARYEGVTYYIRPPSAGTGSAARISIENPFLPTNIRDEMAAAGLSHILLSTNNADMPPAGSNMTRSTQRYVIGADGKFNWLGNRAFTWDAYVQRGETKADEMLITTWFNDNLNKATDVVAGPNGPVCRVNADADPANDDAACVPLNRLGVGVADPAAIDYIMGTPRRLQNFTQDVAAVNLSTNDIEGWAGPISIATGVEWRRDKQESTVDPIYNSGWRFGNYLVSTGEIKVTEGYVETVVPVMEGMEFNGAFRWTDYSTSGNVNTWKAGLTYQPIEDIKLRVSRSRDIRAPNLQELFATGTARTNSADFTGILGLNGVLNFVQRQQGNLNVKPEEADAWGVGLVFTPQFLPGFAASVDWYNIDLKGAIASFSVEQTVVACREGETRFCNNIILNPNGTTVDFVDLFFENQNSMTSTGIDFETSYTRRLGGGQLQLRALATHYIKNILDTGTTAINTAGSNVGDTPDWTYRFSALFKGSDWTTNLTVRGFSAGTLSSSTAEYIECSSNCPAISPGVFTINDNHAPGGIYFDASLTKAFSLGPAESEFFFSVRNLFDRDPGFAMNPQSTGAENAPAYMGTNRTLYDVLGRTFRTGLRLRF